MGNASFKFRVLSFELKTRNLKPKTRNHFVGLGLVFLLIANACGYHFSGRGAGFPEDVRTVYVEPFINRTQEVGMEHLVTSALRSEFYRQGQVQIVEHLDQSDAVLSGVVRSFDTRVVSVNRKDEVLQYETVLTADVSFRRRSPDELLWRTQNTRLAELHSGSRAAVVTTSSEFKTGTLNATDVRRLFRSDIQLTEFQNQEAKERLVERFARDLHQRLMEMF